MSTRRALSILSALVVALTLGLTGCDGGGEVTSEGGGTGSGTHTGSGSGTGSGTGTGTGPSVSIEGEVNVHGSASVTGSEAEVELDDFYFDPTFFEAEPGATITVQLHNEGEASHTFTIDDLEIDETLDAGGEGEVEVTLPDSGPVVFYCRFHQAQGMQGAFDLG